MYITSFHSHPSQKSTSSLCMIARIIFRSNCRAHMQICNAAFSIKEDIEEPKYARKSRKKAVPFLKKKKKKLGLSPSKALQPFSGHNFTIYFTASKPLKRSVIPTSWVLQEDTSDYRGNRFIFICESCDTFNHFFLSPIL